MAELGIPTDRSHMHEFVSKERQKYGNRYLAEKREKASDSGSHEVDLVLARAEFKINNDGAKEDLFNKIDELLLRIM